jgi:hypothetical protein
VQIEMQTFSPEAISLFRAAVRTARRIPTPANTKLIYNIREIFSLYRDLPMDSPKRQHVLHEGWHDVGVLKELLKCEPATLETIFKQFDPIPDNFLKAKPTGNDTEFTNNIVQPEHKEDVDLKIPEIPHVDNEVEYDISSLDQIKINE